MIWAKHCPPTVTLGKSQKLLEIYGKEQQVAALSQRSVSCFKNRENVEQDALSDLKQTHSMFTTFKRAINHHSEEQGRTGKNNCSFQSSAHLLVTASESGSKMIILEKGFITEAPPPSDYCALQIRSRKEILKDSTSSPFKVPGITSAPQLSGSLVLLTNWE